MEYRVQQNRSLQLIQAIDRQGDRNLRVFPKAKVIQAFSQLNPDRDKFFSFLENKLLDPNFGQDNFQKKFRIGEHEKSTPNFNFFKIASAKNLQFLLCQFPPLHSSNLAKSLRRSIISSFPRLYMNIR